MITTPDLKSALTCRRVLLEQTETDGVLGPTDVNKCLYCMSNDLLVACTSMLKKKELI